MHREALVSLRQLIYRRADSTWSSCRKRKDVAGEMPPSPRPLSPQELIMRASFMDLQVWLSTPRPQARLPAAKMQLEL